MHVNTCTLSSEMCNDDDFQMVLQMICTLSRTREGTLNSMRYLSDVDLEGAV